MLDIVINLASDELIDIFTLKSRVNEFATQFKTDEDFNKARDSLKAVCVKKISSADKPPASSEVKP